LPRGSCIGTSTPFTRAANPAPTSRAQRSSPAAIASPSPSRRPILSTQATIAPPSPHGMRSAMSPFSEASMRVAMATPTEIVSMPYALQS